MLSGFVNTECDLIKWCGRKENKQRAYLIRAALSGKHQAIWDNENQTKTPQTILNETVVSSAGNALQIKA